MSKLFKFITLLSLVLISILSLCVALPASAATKKAVVKKKVVEYRYLESLNKCFVPTDRSYKTIRNYEKFTDLKACKNKELQVSQAQENQIKEEQSQAQDAVKQTNVQVSQQLQNNNAGTVVENKNPQNINPKTNTENQPSKPVSTSTYYANCTEARAAGVTPIYRGQPGYASKLDRDNDGIACE